MVMDYGDIFTSVCDRVENQNWYRDGWHATTEEDNVWLFDQDWHRKDDVLVWFHAYGQGDDPEENPIRLDISVVDYLPDRQEFLDELDQDLAPRMKPLIGWEPAPDEEPAVWRRKEFPSDPITVPSRLLEEFAKLQPIAHDITERLDDWLESRTVDPEATPERPPAQTR